MSDIEKESRHIQPDETTGNFPGKRARAAREEIKDVVEGIKR